MSYTVTGGFAPTYRSIFYNSTGNEISEVIGYPMRVNVTKQLTDSGEESLKNSILNAVGLSIVDIVISAQRSLVYYHPTETKYS